jgi:hypothetical protein
MAPEQVLAEKLDGRADIYAVGVVFFRMLTAQLPFKADSGISMAHKQVHDSPTPVRRLRMELPPACEDIITRSLAKSPADRFQTAEDFRAALASLGGSVANGSSASIAVPSPVPASAPDYPTVVMPARTPKRFPLAALVGAIILAGIPTTVYIAWRWWPSKTRAAATSDAPPAAAVNTSPAKQALPPALTPVADTLPPTVPGLKKAESATQARDVISAPAAPADTGSPSSPPLPTLVPITPREVLFPPITFAQVKLLVLDEEKPRDRDVLVRLGVDTLELLEAGKAFETLPYHDVVGVFQSHSREPRWSMPDGTPVPLAKMGGRLSFFKSLPDWITVQTQSSFLPLHVPESELARMVAELEMRIGMKVVRTR